MKGLKDPIGKMGTECSTGSVVGGEGGMAFSWSRLIWVKMKVVFFILRMGSHRSRLCAEAVHAPSLGPSMARGTGLCLVWWEVAQVGIR